MTGAQEGRGEQGGQQDQGREVLRAQQARDLTADAARDCRCQRGVVGHPEAVCQRLGVRGTERSCGRAAGGRRERDRSDRRRGCQQGFRVGREPVGNGGT